MVGLSVSRLVNVTINLSPLAAARRGFGTLLIAGDSDVINPVERIRAYTSLETVATDFGLEAPEYEAASLYFGQSPRPRLLNIGRYVRVASSGQLNGGILSTTEKLIAQWTPITSGGFKITIDGVLKSLSGLNFSAQTNLNGIAAIIDAALTGATCEYDGSKFIITSDTTGAGDKASGTLTFTANPSYGVQSDNTIELTGLPSPGDTVTIQGTLVTFVGSSPVGNQVLIGSDEEDTAANLQTFLENSADVNLALMTYGTIGAITTITARLFGVAGDSYTLAKSGVNITIGGATFSGGVDPDTIEINGVTFTYVNTLPGDEEILVGATKEITATNTRTVLAASEDPDVILADYSVISNILTIEYATPGTDGNAFSLDEDSAGITKSGAFLSGGVVASTVSYAIAPDAGTDISAQLKLTEDEASTPIPGFDAETPVECALAMANFSANWYGLMFAASVQPTDDQAVDVGELIQGLSVSRIFGSTITDTDVLDALVEDDLASRLSDLNYTRSFVQYSENSYAIASFFGRAFSVNFAANRSTITLMYKQEPGVVAEELTETQAQTLQAKRCNVFVEYDNDTAIIQYGVMSGQAYFDEIHGLDWFQNAVQNECYNLLYQSATKIPQTDAGSNQIVNTIGAVCNEAINNGLAAPGVWNADGFGQLQRGDYLKSGFYIYAEPISLQSQSTREQRIAPPITVALKLAGAIQAIDVIVNVNR